MKKSHRYFGIVVLLVLLLGSGTALNRFGVLDPKPYVRPGTLTPVTADTAFPPTSAAISCSVNVSKVYDFNVQDETFFAEGSVHLIWPSGPENSPAPDTLPGKELLTLINAINEPEVLTAEPSSPLPDGRTYLRYRFSGKFFASDLDYRRFPFQTLKLPIIFRLNADEPRFRLDRVHLVPDLEHSSLGRFVDIPGYITTGRHLGSFIFQAPLQPDDPGTAQPLVSRVQMDVVYHTSTVSVLFQNVIPVVVIMTIMLLAPNLAGSLWNVRTVIPPSLILALVLQAQAYRNRIPQLHYLTFMDQVYAVCFLVSLVVFGLFVWSSNRLDNAPLETRAATVAHINRIDFRFQIGLSLGMVLLFTLAWFFPGPLR